MCILGFTFCKLRAVGSAILRGLSPTFSRFTVKYLLLQSSTICIYIARTHIHACIVEYVYMCVWEPSHFCRLNLSLLA